MSVRLQVVESYVKAVKESGLRDRSLEDYYSCLRATLYDIKGDKVLFRTYINDIEYWEYAFSRRVLNKIKFLYITYGCEE